MDSRPRASSLSSQSTSSSTADLPKTKASRPRLSFHNKRVSFDATSVPLPSATWEELASPASLLNPPFPIPEIVTENRNHTLRKAEIDSSIDLKAVLAAGIMEWREEVDAEMQ